MEPDQIPLLRLEDPQSGEVYSFEFTSQIIIGRGPACTLRFEESKSLSRAHCEVVRQARNGTPEVVVRRLRGAVEVDSVPVSEQRVEAGQTWRLHQGGAPDPDDVTLVVASVTHVAGPAIDLTDAPLYVVPTPSGGVHLCSPRGSETVSGELTYGQILHALVQAAPHPLHYLDLLLLPAFADNPLMQARIREHRADPRNKPLGLFDRDTFTQTVQVHVHRLRALFQESFHLENAIHATNPRGSRVLARSVAAGIQRPAHHLHHQGQVPCPQCLEPLV